MNNPPLPTEFAPAERSSESEITRQSELVKKADIQQYIIDCVPDFILVLNKNRQIVYANKSVSLLLLFTDSTSPFGLRPGELLDCEHACESEGGCGTTRFCSQCGAVKAILSSLRGKESVQECRIIQEKTSAAIDIRVWTYPITIEDELFSIFIAVDIANEKRRNVLERIFLHDITNTLTSIMANAEILEEIDPSKVPEFAGKIQKTGRLLLDQIDAHRELVAAETNELTIHITPIDTLALIHEVVNLYRNINIAQGINITIDKKAQQATINSDRGLLARVLGNMLKNALEASSINDTVTIGVKETGDQVEFTVHNPGYIQPDVQLQIFQRSFSTKGFGRGLGTYSVKMLTERYLKGTVTFVSTEQDGTTFFARYPRTIEPQPES